MQNGDLHLPNTWKVTRKFEGVQWVGKTPKCSSGSYLANNTMDECVFNVQYSTPDSNIEKMTNMWKRMGNFKDCIRDFVFDDVVIQDIPT